MKQHPVKRFPVNELVVNKQLNFRNDYDLVPMMESIIHAGRVLEPIFADLETKVVYKGNRRVSACQELLKNPSIAADLRDNIEKIQVIFFEGLTEREVLELMLDHGSQKPLSREETVAAAWRLQRKMYSEDEIITLLYHLFARYTGNTKKSYEASAIPDGPARKKFLKDWLHGTVGNYILSAGTMGELVREQFLLTERAADRALTDEELQKVKFKVKRDRINKLASAKKVDSKEGGWSPDKGGKTFNEAIEEFIREDKGEVAPAGVRKLSPSEMENVSRTMNSDLSKVFLACAGKLEKDKIDLDAMDTELCRIEAIKKATRAIVDIVDISATFSGGEVREILRYILSGPATDFEAYVKRFAVKS